MNPTANLKEKKQIPRARPFTVVLTGGIASGKTAVSALFAKCGAAIIDTDEISRDIVEPGKPALARIATELGSTYLDDRGHLDREKMRRAIFSDPALRLRLESILHPLIRDEALHRAKNACGPYCVVVIPLYSKSTQWPQVDRVLVVDTSRSAQITRVMRRDRIDRDQAVLILQAQPARKDRLHIADDVIVNDGALCDLEPQVERLHQEYLELAKIASKRPVPRE